MVEGGNKKVLRTRKDVVIFLAKHPEIDIPSESFVFKKQDQGLVDETRLGQSIEMETDTETNAETSIEMETNSEKKTQRRKLEERDSSSYEEKVARVME